MPIPCTWSKSEPKDKQIYTNFTFFHHYEKVDIWFAESHSLIWSSQIKSSRFQSLPAWEGTKQTKPVDGLSSSCRGPFGCSALGRSLSSPSSSLPLPCYGSLFWYGSSCLTPSLWSVCSRSLSHLSLAPLWLVLDLALTDNIAAPSVEIDSRHFTSHQATMQCIAMLCHQSPVKMLQHICVMSQRMSCVVTFLIPPFISFHHVLYSGSQKIAIALYYSYPYVVPYNLTSYKK